MTRSPFDSVGFETLNRSSTNRVTCFAVSASFRAADSALRARSIPHVAPNIPRINAAASAEASVVAVLCLEASFFN